MKTPKQSKRMTSPTDSGSIVKRTDKRRISHRTFQTYMARRRDYLLKRNPRF